MRIYYINMAERVDRRLSMEQQFDGLGLLAERIEAVTPFDLTASQKDLSCNPRRLHWLQETELCCTLSHVVALQRFIKSGEAWAAIFEDDVALSPVLAEFLGAFVRNRVQTQLLRLETDNNGVRLSPEVAERMERFVFRRSHGPTSGSAGYIVSRAAALAIIGSPRFLRIPVDHALFNPYERLAKEFSMRHLEPALCAQWDRIGVDGDIARSGLKSSRVSRRSIENKYPLVRLVQRIVDGWEREILIGPQQVFHRVVGRAHKRVVPLLGGPDAGETAKS